MTLASMLGLHFTKPHVKYHFGCDVTRFTKKQNPEAKFTKQRLRLKHVKKMSFLPFL